MGYGGKLAARTGDVRRFNFTGNGSNTAFGLGFAPATQNQLIVTINGVVQHYDAFSVTGSTLTFTGTPAAGDSIQVVAVVDAIGVMGIAEGAVANVSSLAVSGAATFANTTNHTGPATFANTVIATSGITLGNTIQRTLTGDAVAIKVVGSYNGNTIFEVAQSSSDGIMYVRDAQGNASQITGYPAGNSIIRGRVTTPEQPCFHASGGSTTTSGAVSYTTVSVNVGNCYSTSTYRFTAPIAGNYAFDASVLKSNGNTDTVLYFRKNGAQYGDPHDHTGSNYNQITVAAIIPLAVGDYVDVYVNNTTYTSYRNFSGFLVG